MIYSDVIIIGGGPAGATCAFELKNFGIKSIILEKEDFPRTKLCAGWITPKVKHMLEMDDYPHQILHLDRWFVYIHGFKKKTKTSQYSIRRYELDDYLLKRCGAEVIKHEARNIRKEGEFYIIDDKYKCRYLVGAGGTFCPVYRTFFKESNPRSKPLQVTALEKEFKYEYGDRDCHLFFKRGLEGYGWYVPKGGGYLNIGIGGMFHKKNDGKDIKFYWKWLLDELDKKGIAPGLDITPQGYTYFLRDKVEKFRVENAFITGDAAGLATVDFGEGIGPAIESGIICAKAIAKNKAPSYKSIGKKSFKNKFTFFFFGR